jgi:hypothetical protein
MLSCCKRLLILENDIFQAGSVYEVSYSIENNRHAAAFRLAKFQIRRIAGRGTLALLMFSIKNIHSSL